MEEARAPRATGEETRRQRDRFVAFSFAATDLVFEIDPDGRITFVSGAARELTGRSGTDLTGSPWLELFDPRDQAMLARVVGRLRDAGRSGPIAARLAGRAAGPATVVFSACRLPQGGGVSYCTLSAANLALTLQDPGRPRDEESGLLDSKGFSEAARDTLEASRVLGKPIELTLLDLTGGGASPVAADAERQAALLTDLGNVLRARSLGGELAGRLADGRFGVVHERSIDGAEIEEDVLALIRPFAAGGEAIALDRNTLDLEAEDLSQEEAAQALVYTINQFATSEPGVTIRSLHDGFKGLAEETRSKIGSLKAIVADRRFGFELQPIVDLASRQVRYYELLLRLQKGQSPYPWITFAEGVGLIQDLDLAVFACAVEFLRNGTADPGVAVAVNLSGKSLSSPVFVDQLTRLLVAHRVLNRRLLIEITESSEITDLVQANAVIQSLRKVGYAVGLDDFGAGAASFQYLRALDVEFVKFDGVYVRRGLESEREGLMLKAMAGLCHDLGMRTVGEMIESEDQARQLVSLGVTLGQGYLFGRPASPEDHGIAPPAGPGKTVRAAGFAKQRFNPFTGAEIVHARA